MDSSYDNELIQQYSSKFKDVEFYLYEITSIGRFNQAN